MRVLVERSDLVWKGACREGIELFDALAPSGTWSGEWTALHAAWLAKDHGNMCSWCVANNILPPFPRDADLRGADLCYANLRGADMRVAIVEGALFDGAVFGNTYMTDGSVR